MLACLFFSVIVVNQGSFIFRDAFDMELSIALLLCINASLKVSPYVMEMLHFMAKCGEVEAMETGVRVSLWVKKCRRLDGHRGDKTS